MLVKAPCFLILATSLSRSLLNLSSSFVIFSPRFAPLTSKAFNAAILYSDSFITPIACLRRLRSASASSLIFCSSSAILKSTYYLSKSACCFRYNSVSRSLSFSCWLIAYICVLLKSDSFADLAKMSFWYFSSFSCLYLICSWFWNVSFSFILGIMLLKYTLSRLATYLRRISWSFLIFKSSCCKALSLTSASFLSSIILSRCTATTCSLFD